MTYFSRREDIYHLNQNIDNLYNTSFNTLDELIAWSLYIVLSKYK
jgi:hypothetical protein